MLKVILCIVVLGTMLGVKSQSRAQELPYYNVTVFIAGDAGEKHDSSDVNGYLSTPSNVMASYRYI
jgi:hypothetical protein